MPSEERTSSLRVIWSWVVKTSFQRRMGDAAPFFLRICVGGCMTVSSSSPVCCARSSGEEGAPCARMYSGVARRGVRLEL